ncbi:MAG: GNAT family N-acetyltransferase [Armatimonadetes bacterium]|nr:GNAT family N-acetyltransferase [Armatimonadota bacterium]
MDSGRKVKLKDGREVLIRFLQKGEDPKELCNYINSLVEEDSAITLDEFQTPESEAAWLEAMLQAQVMGRAVYLVAEHEGRKVAGANASRGMWRERDNVILGIAIVKDFRGVGLGEILMKELIDRARALSPRNIFLMVFEGNDRAIALYKKLKFREIGRLPGWVRWKGKYVDHIYMLLED